MKKLTIYLAWLMAYLAWLGARYLDIKLLGQLVAGARNIKLHVQTTWFSSANGPLVAAAALLTQLGWPIIALAVVASVSAALPALDDDDRRLKRWTSRWPIELTALTRVISLTAIIKWLALGIMGGGGIWAHLPSTAGVLLDTAALLLGTASIIALMVVMIALLAMPLVYAVRDVYQLVTR